MGLQTAVALESAAMLRTAHVDLCLTPGNTARMLRTIAGPRLANRIVHGIPAQRIQLHPQITAAARLRRHLLQSGQDTKIADSALIRIYSLIARRCQSEIVVGTQASSLELFKDRGYKVMEQISAPRRYESSIASAELARFPGWEPAGITKLRSWDHRVEAEWQEADLIFVPSAHLIDISRHFGADPSKFRLVPFPARSINPEMQPREFSKRRRLRVVFAGTVMLRKGVQYIYEALRQRPDLPVQMDFYGPLNLARSGISKLAEVGTVHGPVPRIELLDIFSRADVLLFPSLSEGSALVTLEATALGLPVVATAESGAPASAMTIRSRSPESIIEAIEKLVDDPGELAALSKAGIAEANSRTATSYAQNIVASIERLVIPR